MHKILFYLILSFVGFPALAQNKFEADRPGESRSSEVVKGNHLQAEFGLRKEKLSDQVYLYQHPTALLRYGLFSAIELRVEAASQSIRNELNKRGSDGLLPVEFGVKAKVLPEYKGFPSVAVLGQVGIPSTSSKDYYNKRIPMEFRALFGNTFNKNLKIQYNAGVKWEGEQRIAQWMYSFSPVIKVSDKVNVFIEEYAFMGRSMSAEHYLDGGVEVYLNNHIMFDASAGKGLSGNSSTYFLSGGVSFSLPVR